MKVVVFSSTGGTGLELNRQALALGHEVWWPLLDTQKLSR